MSTFSYVYLFTIPFACHRLSGVHLRCWLCESKGWMQRDYITALGSSYNVITRTQVPLPFLNWRALVQRVRRAQFAYTMWNQIMHIMSFWMSHGTWLLLENYFSWTNAHLEMVAKCWYMELAMLGASELVLADTFSYLPSLIPCLHAQMTLTQDELSFLFTY